MNRPMMISQTTRRTALVKVAGVILILAVVGLWNVGDYGISSDEEVEIEMVKWNSKRSEALR